MISIHLSVGMLNLIRFMVGYWPLLPILQLVTSVFICYKCTYVIAECQVISFKIQLIEVENRLSTKANEIATALKAAPTPNLFVQ